MCGLNNIWKKLNIPFLNEPREEAGFSHVEIPMNERRYGCKCMHEMWQVGVDLPIRLVLLTVAGACGLKLLTR